MCDNARFSVLVSYRHFTLFSQMHTQGCQAHRLLPTADPTINRRVRERTTKGKREGVEMVMGGRMTVLPFFCTHTCKLWRESVILLSCAPQHIFLMDTHTNTPTHTHTHAQSQTMKHLWELCQTEVNLRLALSFRLFVEAYYFLFLVFTAKKFTITVIVSCRCVWVSVCCRIKYSRAFHKAHFGALKFDIVARIVNQKKSHKTLSRNLVLNWQQTTCLTYKLGDKYTFTYSCITFRVKLNL